MIVNNGIDTEAFTRTPQSIVEAKTSFGMGGEPVFGHIGRFSPEKNHLFLLDVFASIKKELPLAKLMLVGRGPEEGVIHERAKELSLSDSVIFAGVLDDIPSALRAMDVFLFPSLYEGLGISFIEAQTAGLHCIASTGVPEHAHISPRAKRVPTDSKSDWAKESIAAYRESQQVSDDLIRLAKQEGFDIKSVAESLSDLYRECSSRAPNSNTKGA